MLRLGKGMLKQKGPMLEETDFSQLLVLFLFFLVVVVWWILFEEDKTWLCASRFHIIDAKCVTFMTLLLFIANQLSYIQKERHLV